MLQHFNLFPERRLLRFRRNPDVNTKCGGIASLAIITVLTTILTIKLIEMFKMETIYSTSKTQNFDPPNSTINTYQEEGETMPYMLALQFRDRGCPNYTYTIEGEYRTSYTHTDQVQIIVKEPIILEKCTGKHFAIAPTFSSRAQRLEVENWTCLPLNKTYIIGGSLEVSDVYKYIKIKIQCDNPCDVGNCGSIKVFQLNSLINADSQQPFEYELKLTIWT